jgi:hypothetical membrane protein
MNLIGHIGMVISAFFLFLVGVFPNYKRSKFEELMHVVPSFACIILGVISLFFVGRICSYNDCVQGQEDQKYN